MKNEPTAVTLRIVLEQPTAGVDFGLQRGHGSDYEVVGKQRSKGRDLKFEFTVTTHTSKKPGRNAYLPNFAGPSCKVPPASDLFTSTSVLMPARRTRHGVAG